MAALGSQPLFEQLYAAHHQTLHAYFLGRTADPDLALDLLQDTFLRLWRNLHVIGDLSTVRQRAWLFAVARNLVIDQYRAQSTRRATGQALVDAAQTADSTAPPAEAEVAHGERLQELDRAIRALPDDLRVVLVLSVLGERTSAEVGELLGRPPGTVRYQLAEARRRLAHGLRVLEVVTQ